MYKSLDEMPKVNADVLPSNYHTIYDINLGVINSVQTKYLKIYFNQSDYSIKVDALPNTFYHIVFAEGIYSVKGCQVITNIDQLFITENVTLLYFIHNVFWLSGAANWKPNILD